MIPIRLEMWDFTSYAHAVIDFTKFDVALIVGALEGNTYVSNGVGKSNIFEAIRFVLFNKCRFSSKEKVVRRGRVQCKVEYIFEMDGSKYKVVRTLNKKSGIVGLVFYKQDDDDWNSGGYTCDTPTATTDKIEKVIGMSYDTFINSICFRQNDVYGFAGARAAKRKEILKEVLRIEIWDELQEIAKKYEKILCDQENVLSDRIDALDGIEKEYGVVCKQLNDIVVLSESLNENIEKTEKEVEKYNINQDIGKRLDDINNLLNKMVIKKDGMQSQVKANNKDIANAQNDCNNLENRLKDYAKDVAIVNCKIRDKALRILNESIDIKYSNEILDKKALDLQKEQQELNKIDIQLSQFVDLESGTECPTCLTVLSEDIINRRSEKTESLKNIKKEKEKTISLLKNTIAECQKAIRKADESAVEIERTELIIAKRMAVVSDALEKNDRIKEEFSKMSEERKALKEEKDTLSKLDVAKMLEEKDKLSSKLHSMRQKLIELSAKRGHLKAKSEELELKISEKNTLIEQKEKILDDIDVYSRVGKSFGKDGIQAIIMENITEDLKRYTNAILKSICNEPMGIDFVTQRQATNGSWKEDFELSILVDNESIDFDDLSGGVQVRVAIALRLGLSRLLMKRIGSNVRFLLLDEVDQALDMHGIEALASAIKILSKEFKILVISHNESMKEKFDHVITVIKGPDGSIIK